MTHADGSRDDVDSPLGIDPGSMPGYTYGAEPGPGLARSPLSLDELSELVAAVDLTDADVDALRQAARILAPQASQMVAQWREQIGRHPFMARYSAHTDGTPNPEYAAASKPRFERWIVDVCTRPLDRDWLNYQEEIGLRHTREKKNQTDGADSLAFIPLRFVLAFTAYVLVTSREYLATGNSSVGDVDRMHAAFTKAVMLHVTAWSRAYEDPSQW